MLGKANVVVRALLGSALVLAAAACGGSSSDATGTTDYTTDQALAIKEHISPGVERARQAALPKSATPVDTQRGSVHLGNAYWLGQLAFLAYSNEPAVRSGLQNFGFDTSHAQFFSNTCTGAFAFYLTGDGFSVLVFRGTEPNWQDWATDLDSFKTTWQGHGLVHTGFLARFRSVWEADPKCGVPSGIHSWLLAHHTADRTTGKTPDGELYVTGHSMGAALATLALAHTQADVCGTDRNCTRAPSIPISALYNYGSPKVGDQDFAYATADLAKGRTPYYRFVNADDIVTIIPRDLDLAEALVSDYRHVGYETEGEDVFQVWMKDKELEIASFVLHLAWSVSDHLNYVAPLLFQAKSRNEYH